MDINTLYTPPVSSTSSAGQIAKQGLDAGFEKLTQQSSDIARSIIAPDIEANNPTTFDYSVLEQPTLSSLEDSLVNMHLNKTQMLSLIKVLEVENELFDDALGRIFDTKA